MVEFAIFITSLIKGLLGFIIVSILILIATLVVIYSYKEIRKALKK